MVLFDRVIWMDETLPWIDKKGHRRKEAKQTYKWISFCRRTTLSGVVVTSMAERPGKVDASVSDLRMDRWMKEVTALAACACGAH